ncbi:Signal transduction histidine-protein kinase BaeS [compost metagenome]
MIIWILMLSLICTLLTWTLILWIGENRVNAENYYERMIPEIEAQLVTEHDRIVKPSGREAVEAIIPSEGFKYKVVDQYGKHQYGTYSDTSDISADVLITRLNQVVGESNYFVKYVPIMDEGHQLRGTILLYYKLKLTPIHASDATLVSVGIPLLLITPFVYIVLFTVLFVRRLDRELKGPIEQLMEATHHIGQKDLQFTLEPGGRIKEISQLTEAFEQMRRELSDSLQREWKLQKDRREMVAALAHDIRTPLTIIQGHVEGLDSASKKGIDRFESYLKTIKMNVQRAVKLVHDLNQTAVLENESFQLSLVRFDPVDFIEEKNREYELWCSREHIQFAGRCTDLREKKGDISADPNRLSQVLDNLLSNSIRFAESGKGMVALEATLTSTELRILISDNGPGFAKGTEKEVFQPFYQEGSGGRRNGYAGLGLYIAKSIVVKHGGEIDASQGKEGGALVAFSIPITRFQQ